MEYQVWDIIFTVSLILIALAWFIRYIIYKRKDKCSSCASSGNCSSKNQGVILLNKIDKSKKCSLQKNQ